ncbi:hypothetical protein AN958_02952 [Leucoagaricus sp. SymC.cos]|nr:hypothetical protein AN958_02952 [Leucoagaricus sp. SymC.cos]
MWGDIVDHRDIFVLSLFTSKGAVNLLNVYSDDTHTAINLLSREVDALPAFIYMGGDFNCHSEVWDPSHTSHPLIAQCLLEFASDIGLEWARPSNPGLTHIPHNPDLASSVIDLVFTGPLSVQSNLPRLDLDCRGPSDHVPLSTLIPILESEIRISRMVIPRESPEESGFLIDLATGLWALNVGDLSSPDLIEAAAVAVAEVFSLAWNAHAKEVIVTVRSKSWWNDECAQALARYQASRDPAHWKLFCKASCQAKWLGHLVEKVQSAVMDTLSYLNVPVTLEAFDADTSEAHPGRHLMDWFLDCIQITDFPPREEDVNVLHILNAELDQALALNDCIVVTMDVSVGRDKAYQAIFTAWVWASGMPVRQSRQAAGRVTAPDVELHAIWMGVFAACAQEGTCHIVLFTDHPASAQSMGSTMVCDIAAHLPLASISAAIYLSGILAAGELIGELASPGLVEVLPGLLNAADVNGWRSSGAIFTERLFANPDAVPWSAKTMYLPGNSLSPGIMTFSLTCTMDMQKLWDAGMDGLPLIVVQGLVDGHWSGAPKTGEDVVKPHFVNYESRWLEGIGHTIYYEAPNVFVDILIEFGKERIIERTSHKQSHSPHLIGLRRKHARDHSVDRADDFLLLGTCDVGNPEPAVLNVPEDSAVVMVDCLAELAVRPETGLETDAVEEMTDERAVDTLESVLPVTDTLVLLLETGLDDADEADVLEVATEVADLAA